MDITGRRDGGSAGHHQPGRTWRAAAFPAGLGLLTLGLAACGGTSATGGAPSTTSPAAVTSSSASSQSSASSPSSGKDTTVTVGAEPVVVPLLMANGTKLGTAIVAADGNVSSNLGAGADDVPDDPSGVSVVTTLVDATGGKLGTITVRPDGSVISVTGSGTFTTGSDDSPGMSMPSMTMPSMTMPSMPMNMDMTGMPTPPGQLNESINTGGAPTTVVSTSCNADGTQCSRQEIVDN